MHDILYTTAVYYVKSLSFKRAIDFILRHFYSCSSWLYIHQSLNICKLNFPFVYQFYTKMTTYILDALCRQPIKLFQVVSTSKFHEYLWNNVFLFFFVPSGFWRASEASNIECLEN